MAQFGKAGVLLVRHELAWPFRGRVRLALDGYEATMPTARAAGTIRIGSDLTVNRLGFGGMRLCGPGIWGWPEDRQNALQVLRRAVELGVNFIDTADSYGPEVNEEQI